VIVANGQNDAWNDQLIDGFDNNERNLGLMGVRPSIDGIDEVKIDTSSSRGGCRNQHRHQGWNQRVSWFCVRIFPKRHLRRARLLCRDHQTGTAPELLRWQRRWPNQEEQDVLFCRF
jgi:hypothetical protein